MFVSQVSNVSTRAVVNTSAWAESSGANSRRSSSVGPTSNLLQPHHSQQLQGAHPTPPPPHQQARIGQHLSRLHKKVSSVDDLRKIVYGELLLSNLNTYHMYILDSLKIIK